VSAVAVAATRPVRQVLVVDPEAQIPKLVSLLLGAGYHVDAAIDVDAALERIHATPYDAVLIELAWPDGGDGPADQGLALLRRLRKGSPELAIIAFTALPSLAAAVAAMRAGAFDVLRKTAGADELRAAVDRAAEHGNLAREVAPAAPGGRQGARARRDRRRVAGDAAAARAGRARRRE
jgi:DNA-binding NtrC family response regulator